MSKYKVGQRVKVKHRNGHEWEGEIVKIANPYDDMWEYEVTNSPEYWGEAPHGIWYPLLWEPEITGDLEP